MYDVQWESSLQDVIAADGNPTGQRWRAVCRDAGRAATLLGRAWNAATHTDVKGGSNAFQSMHVSFFFITIDAEPEEGAYMQTGSRAGTGAGPHYRRALKHASI